MYLALPITRAVLGPPEDVSELDLEIPLVVCPSDDRGARRREVSRIRSSADAVRQRRTNRAIFFRIN